MIALGTLVFALAVALAVAFAWARGRVAPLRREIEARPVMDLDAIRAEYAAHAVQLDPATTRDVLRALGDALGLDPGRLRLDDVLPALWDMSPHAGFHQRATFEDWIVKRNPKLPANLEALTVGELVAELQKIPRTR